MEVGSRAGVVSSVRQTPTGAAAFGAIAGFVMVIVTSDWAAAIYVTNQAAASRINYLPAA